MAVAGSRRPAPMVEPPTDVDPRDLAPEVRSQLRTLSKVAADRVARHLVAAGRLVDEDPEAALVQARAARALGARVAVVRQAVGETAYAAGEWAEAIAELRTARRMTGDDSALPLLADAERALGRPDRALRLAQSAQARSLPPAERVEMRIVEAGARRDLGQLDAALITLQGTGLDRRAVEPWSARLWYAYADLLVALGREDEARDWFAAAAAVDQDGTTDADERVLELDGVAVLTDDEELTDDGQLLGQQSDPRGDHLPAPAEGQPQDAPSGNASRADRPPRNESPPAEKAPVDRAPTGGGQVGDERYRAGRAGRAADQPPEPAPDQPPAPAPDQPADQPPEPTQEPAPDQPPEPTQQPAPDQPPADGRPTDRAADGDPADREPVHERAAEEGSAARPALGGTVAAIAFSDAAGGQDQSGSSS
ncbi:MAG: hypothetical protein ACJ73E_11835 [Mycobacteriales bacterium]